MNHIYIPPKGFNSLIQNHYAKLGLMKDYSALNLDKCISVFIPFGGKNYAVALNLFRKFGPYNDISTHTIKAIICTSNTELVNFGTGPEARDLLTPALLSQIIITLKDSRDRIVHSAIPLGDLIPSANDGQIRMFETNFSMINSGFKILDTIGISNSNGILLHFLYE